MQGAGITAEEPAWRLITGLDLIGAAAVLDCLQVGCMSRVSWAGVHADGCDRDWVGDTNMFG